METIATTTLGIVELRKVLVMIMDKAREEKEPLIQRILSDIVTVREHLNSLRLTILCH